MPLLLRLVKANRLSPCWENMTAGGFKSASRLRATTSVTPGENGHGCGHNLLGNRRPFAAAIAVKKWLEQYGQGGTVRFYGCPGEEGGSGKTFMVRARGYLMMWMRHSPGTRKPLPACSIPARWQTIQASWCFKGDRSHYAANFIWDAAPLMP